MMDRRRALMMAKADSNDILYQLQNKTATAGEVINTNTNILRPGLSMTILFDINLTSNPTSGNGRLWKLLNEYSSDAASWGLRVGKSSSTATVQTLYWYHTSLTMNGVSTSSGRYRYIITHEADSDNITLLCKKNNGTLYTYTQTSTFVSTLSNFLYLGHGASADDGLPPCVINELSIYNRILSQAEINAFFA